MFGTPRSSGIQHGFDYYVRSITTSLLAIAIVGATLYLEVVRGRTDTLLVGWTGIIVGVYFGYHVTLNSRRTAKRESDPADMTISEK